MGACFSQESRRMHERLDEFDDDCFIEVENHSSVDEKKHGWLEEKKSSGGSIQLEAEKSEHSRRNLSENSWTIPASKSEPLPITNSFEDISFLMPSPSTIQSSSIEPLLRSNAFANKPIAVHKQETFWAGRNSGWYDKQKGRALQLRLAKHHFLQMAVTSQPAPNGNSVSPVTVGSNFFAEVDTTFLADDNTRDFYIPWPKSVPTPLASKSRSKEENANLIRQHGLIWKEISCEDNITAVAMNRISCDFLSFGSASRNADPLLLAMGDEKGHIEITQIVDERLESTDAGDTGGNCFLEYETALCSEAVEFSIEGKVRSIDFGSYEHLVVGGDGCCAWILHVIVDTSYRTPKDVMVVHKLERIDRIYAARFSHDQKFLAVGGFDGKVALVSMITVWKNEEQERDYDSDGEDSLSLLLRDSVIELDRPGLIYSLDWSPTGDYLAVAGSDKVCGIYNASNFDLIHETTIMSATIQDLRWSNDGNYLAVGEKEVVIIGGKPPFKIQRKLSHTSTTSAMAQFRYRVTSLCWSPSDSYLAIGGSDGRCLLVETKGWALVYEHNAMKSINALAWGQQIYGSNGDVRRYLVLSDDECNVALIKAGVESKGSENTDDVSSVASSSYQSQSTMSSDWVLRQEEFRDVDDVQEKSVRGLKSQATITTIAFSKIGKSNKTSSYLAYAADDCSLTIMRTRDWKTVFQVEFAKPIRSLVFSNSNNYLALGGDEGILNVLSVRSRTMILNSILSSSIKSIAFSKHDERLGVGLEDGIMSLLSPESNWESVGEIDQSESCVSCQDWTSNMFACGRINGSVTLFDIDKVFGNFFVPVKEFTSNHPVRSLTFGPNGKFIAIGGDSGVVSILSAQSGWELFHQINIGYCILSLKWSPAGRYMALASAGTSTCCVYDTITWKIVKQVEESVSSISTNDEALVSCLAWSMDSKWMAIGGLGSGVNILDTSTWRFMESSANVNAISVTKEDS